MKLNHIYLGIHLRPFFIFLTLLSATLIWACNDSNSDTDSGSGSLTFGMDYRGTTESQQLFDEAMDCSANNIVTIEAAVYDHSDKKLVHGGEWNCEDRQWVIDPVPAGSDLKIVVLGKDADDNIVLRGETTEMTVTDGVVTDAGVIHCFAFAPRLRAPQDGAVINTNSPLLTWQSVKAASTYRVFVSLHNDMTDPLIDTTIPESSLATSGLPVKVPCYWRVVAYDTNNKSSNASPIYTFTCDPGSSGTPPELGSLTFSIDYQDTNGDQQGSGEALDCAANGIEIIEAEVYDVANQKVTQGGPWLCEDQPWTIANIPMGNHFTIVVFGRDGDKSILLRGEASNLTIMPGITTEAGLVPCFAFTPGILAPLDGAVVNTDTPVLTWQSVRAADRYRVVVSQHQDMTDPLIEITSREPNFTTSGLPVNVTLYWFVMAYDSLGYSSMASPIHTFTCDPGS